MRAIDFAPIMAVLSAAIARPVSEETTRVYFDLLKDLPLPALQLAAKRAVMESQYPVLPPVGVLRKLALESLTPARLLADEAWERVRRAIRRYGYYREADGLASLPQEVRRAAECLGWQSLCDSTEPEVCRAQFRKAYEAIVERERRMELLPDAMQCAIATLSGTRAWPTLPSSPEAS